MLDGVEGPRIESVLANPSGSPVQTASYWMGAIPQIVFSDDGTHCAYLAKMGDEYVVMLDNKELARGAMAPTNAMGNVPLMFSAGGKHLFYTDAANGKFRIVVDGKMGPDSSHAMPLATSPDGAHYAYTGFVGGLGNGTPNWAFVDGRQVNFFGDSLQYTGKNVLLSRMNVENATVLLINGRPMLKASRLDPTWISPDGNQIAVVISPKQGDPSFLTVNGKIVDGTQGLTVDNVYFSPNGKRYAALCTTKTHSRFMIIDGKKGEEYQGIAPSVNQGGLQLHWAFVAGGDGTELAKAQPQVPGFTPDSSKFVYIATQGAQQFMDVEDQESNGFRDSYPLQPVLSATGNHIAFYGVASDGTQHVYVDDKDLGLAALSAPGAQRISGLTFSPGGTRYAYVGGGTLFVDGVAQPGYLNGANYLFSPDDQHIAYMASIGNSTCFVVDGKIVDKSPGQLRYAFFSPDSQHLVWVRLANYQSQGTKDSHMLFVDGQPVIHLTDNGVDSSYQYHFHFAAGNVMTFIGRTDNYLRRFTLTPSSDVSGMLASATVPTGK
jgi:redox-sensitive bicupin YhaK (pirin superfamily)